MSMLPRLWVFYITEVFWKISKTTTFPQQNDSENDGLASRFLPRCFSCSAFKNVWWHCRVYLRAKWKATHRWKTSERELLTSVCLITKRSVWHWLASGFGLKKQKASLPWPVPSWAESSRDKAPQTSPSSAYGSTASHPSRSTSWSGGHSTPNTWEDKGRPRGSVTCCQSRQDKHFSLFFFYPFRTRKTRQLIKTATCWQCFQSVRRDL